MRRKVAQQLGLVTAPTDHVRARELAMMRVVLDGVPRAIGFVIKAPSIDAISETTANHGGTEFKVLDDFGDSTIETDFAATRTFGVTHRHATSREQKNHSYTAEAYR